jgi:hypothetical protein
VTIIFNQKPNYPVHKYAQVVLLYRFVVLHTGALESSAPGLVNLILNRLTNGALEVDLLDIRVDLMRATTEVSEDA